MSREDFIGLRTTNRMPIHECVEFDNCYFYNANCSVNRCMDLPLCTTQGALVNLQGNYAIFHLKTHLRIHNMQL